MRMRQIESEIRMRQIESDMRMRKIETEMRMIKIDRARPSSGCQLSAAAHFFPPGSSDLHINMY
jgi:hypothetical protein